MCLLELACDCCRGTCARAERAAATDNGRDGNAHVLLSENNAAIAASTEARNNVLQQLSPSSALSQMQHSTAHAAARKHRLQEQQDSPTLLPRQKLAYKINKRHHDALSNVHTVRLQALTDGMD